MTSKENIVEIPLTASAVIEKLAVEETEFNMKMKAIEDTWLMLPPFFSEE